MSPVTVMCKTNATRILNRCEKYNKALNICKEVTSAMAYHGQSKFDRYVREMQRVKDVITSGKNLCLVIENEANSGDCSVPVGPMSNERSPSARILCLVQMMLLVTLRHR